MIRKHLPFRLIKGSLSEQAYQQIRQMILRGDLPAGAAVARRPLAEVLRLGIPAVSEALLRLEYEGLVESWPRIGTRVRVPSLADVRGNYILREALESQAARLFAEKASQAEKQEMQAMAVEVDGMHNTEQSDLFGYLQLHQRFHHRLAECAGCEAIVDAIERTGTLLRTWQYAMITDYREEPSNYHQELLVVLCGGSVEDADRAMRQHVRHGMEEVLRRMEKYFAREARSPGVRPSPELATETSVAQR